MRTWPLAWQLPPWMSIRRNNCFFTLIISEGSARGHDLNVKPGTEIRTGDTHIPVPIPNPIWLAFPPLRLPSCPPKQCDSHAPLWWQAQAAAGCWRAFITMFNTQASHSNNNNNHSKSKNNSSNNISSSNIRNNNNNNMSLRFNNNEAHMANVVAGRGRQRKRGM